MKKLLLASLLVVGTSIGHSQGTFNFSNFSGPVDAPVTKGLGGAVDSTTYMAGVAWAPGVVSDSSALSWIAGSETAFFGSDFPGYFFGSNISPGADVNGVITLQVYYWNSAAPGGGSFATAKGAQLGEWGQSGLFQVTLGSSALGTPADLVGLTPASLTINAVPEPTSLALGCIGSLALLAFRRRK